MRLLYILAILVSGCTSIQPKQLVLAQEGYADKINSANSAYSSADFNAAKIIYEQVAKLDLPAQHAIHVRFRLGNIAVRNDRLVDALSYYRAVLAIKPDHIKAHHNLAVVSSQLAEKHMSAYIAFHEPANNKYVDLLSSLQKFAREDLSGTRVKQASSLHSN